MNPLDVLRAPLFVSWQMTRDCNIACVHCCTDSAPGKRLADEMSRDEAMAFAADIVRNEVPYVMLCGGEPLLVPHFMEVAEYLGHAGVQLKIETNGQAFDDGLARRLARLPIRPIQISLDGDTQEVYGRQRPGGALEKAHAACRAVREHGMPLEVTFAPTRINIHQAEAVIARARALGAFRFNSGQLMRIGTAARLFHKIEPSRQAYAGFRELLDRAAACSDRDMEFCHLPFTVEEGLRQSLATPPATILVLPNGLVKVAAAIGYVCGDVRRMTLAEAWKRYRAAWHSAEVIAAIERAIADNSFHANANTWKSTPNGVLEHVEQGDREGAGNEADPAHGLGDPEDRGRLRAGDGTALHPLHLIEAIER